MEEEIMEKKKIKGTVVLMKKNVLDMNDLKASLFDRVHELFGKGVSLQLISAEHTDPVTLDDVPGHGRIHFVCNSWVYPAHRYKYDRVFFSNKSKINNNVHEIIEMGKLQLSERLTYLPCETPEPLRKYREEELVNLRGNGKGRLKEWDRVYDYATYNDLAMPERGSNFERPVLGRHPSFPYPRRGRTGRKPHKKDPLTESRLFLLRLDIYVPRDEQFSLVKFSDFLAYAVKSLFQVLVPELAALCDKTINEFDSFQDVLDLYEGGIKLPNDATIKKIRDCLPWEMIRELVRNDGERLMKFPTPAVIKEDKSAWRTDEEFARETLAGVNPVIISRLQEFPPASKLDPKAFGNQKSTITKEQIEPYMNGLTVEEALERNKLFILNHHDALMPYLRKINSTSTKTYASRTLFLLQDDDTLKPLAIELSLPHSQGDSHGAVSKVFTPAEEGVEGSVWQLAKAYAAVNDSGYHQLVSHWLNTHAVIEPFIIASNRHLSVIHPIYKLLHPHFKDTMNINALARQTLINAGGVLELTVFPGKYALEMSSAIYRNWVFTDQALPVDLVKRGMAIPDSSCPHGLKLMIEDYPYAVDGLEIWEAIETWVTEYCSFYYPSDEVVKQDTEIQSWWEETRIEGHGDLKDEPWWPEINSRAELIRACTIIIWVASAFHAAVNFGQYPYAGYLPNRPTVSRRFMPEPGTPEYAELEKDPDLAFLKTITAQIQTVLGVSLIEVLSRHSTDEIYLGQRDTPEWTSDAEPLAAFEKFGKKLIEIEGRIMARNNDSRLKNRVGPVKMPYTLLYPNTSDYSKEGGLTGKGIPNSISI
ncbi:Lipoxygenase [Corchorus olitorius]|uniref:Lipoxygenase n=1 Tax=Corchorus olitorius TaxID=93759 RepID=A0A1R3KFL4_9ROSI|nr:Lipoxygenase [Corchorus olitorius]